MALVTGSSIGIGEQVARRLSALSAQGVKGLPGTLAEVLSARLGELTGDARQVMEAAAVGGANISETDVAAVLDVPGDRVVAALREGSDRQILTVTQGSAEFGFRHALLREAVMDSLLPGRLATLHRRWAQHLAATPAAQTDAGRAVRVARHWHAAHDTDHAFAASLTAARLLRSAAAPDEELRMLEQALSLWDTVAQTQIVARSDRSTLLGEAGAAAVRAGVALRALDLLDAALTNMSEAGQEVRTADLLLHKSLAHEHLGRATMEEPTRAVEALSAVADEPAAAEMMAMALGMLAFRSSAVGEFVEAESFALRAVEAARHSSRHLGVPVPVSANRRTAMYLEQSLGVSWTRGPVRVLAGVISGESSTDALGSLVQGPPPDATTSRESRRSGAEAIVSTGASLGQQ